MAPSIFTRIVNGEISSYKIAESDRYYAFLDINPLKRGHCLVIPKREVDYIFDLDDEHLTGLHLFAKKVAIALKKAIPCERIGIAVVGLEVPHVHIHLIPLDSIEDLNFMNMKLSLESQEMKEICNSIVDAFEN
jgi:histidine triad (HIT) family protein